MQSSLSRYKKWFGLFKILILLGSLYLLYIRLSDSALTLSQVSGLIKDLPNEPLFWAILALLPVNLLLEMFRWWVFAFKLPHINFRQVFKGVFAGFGLGIAIPQYLSDYGGRLLYLKQGHRIKGMLPLTLSNTAQFMVLLAFGIWGLWVIIPDKAFYPTFGLSAYWLFCLLGLFIPYKLMGWFIKIGIPTRWLSIFQQGERVAFWQILLGWLLAHLRFVVFSTQFVWALYLVDYNLNFATAIAMVWVIFLLKGGIPAFSFMGDLGVR